MDIEGENIVMLIDGKIVLYKNGIVIKQKSNFKNEYLGIEGNNWFIDLECEKIEEHEREYFYKYYCENIEMAWSNENCVDCCSDINYMYKYQKICKENNIDYITLFCESEKNNPRWEDKNYHEIEDKLIFLGFDYAYAGGSFYSCILNDVMSKRIVQFSHIKLNEYGLLSTEEEMIEFILLREELKNKLGKYTFEEGEFIVYKLWKVCL